MSTEAKTKCNRSYVPWNNRRGNAEAAPCHALEQ